MKVDVQTQRASHAAPGLACLACQCMGVTHGELAEAISADPDATVASMRESLGCGAECGSCVPTIQEALGQRAWFPAAAEARPITRSCDDRGRHRLIYRVELTLRGYDPYPQVQPGQHVVVRANTGSAVVDRSYTVVAQDAAGRRLTLAIRRCPEGELTPWLLDQTSGRRDVEVSLPGGPGLTADGYRSAVFFAGGVGVTPAVAMVNALGRSATLHLDYSVTDADDAAFLARFQARQEDRPGFTFHLRETSRSGQVQAADVRAIAAANPRAKFFICGPQAYVDLVRRALRRARVPGWRIHVELFALRSATSAPRSSRWRGYAAGLLLAIGPGALLFPELQDVRPHGHPNIGHETLKCVACHVEAPGSLRQTLQAKTKHVLGLRETGAVLGMHPVTSGACVRCHANPDDQHAAARFLEPRFEQARAETGAENCVSCHREHSGVRVTIANPGYCVSCHATMTVKNERSSPTHEELVRLKRWETCLQCHDYHQNHRWRAPLRLVDASTVEQLKRYLRDSPSPYGATLRKAQTESR